MLHIHLNVMDIVFKQRIPTIVYRIADACGKPCNWASKLKAPILVFRCFIIGFDFDMRDCHPCTDTDMRREIPNRIEALKII